MKAHSLHTTAADQARWLAAVFRRDAALLAAADWQAFLAPQRVPLPADHPERAFGLVDWTLGFAWHRLSGRAGGVLVHGGSNPGFTNLVLLDPDSGWGLALLCNADQALGFVQALAARLGLLPAG